MLALSAYMVQTLYRLFTHLLTLLAFIGIPLARAQAQHTSADNRERPCFIGSTAFMVLTPIVEPSPRYFQLNFGYSLTPKDVISVEAITWEYQGPLGRPYGSNYEDAATDFPGSVQAYGAGLAYKRFLWRGGFAQAHATAFRQNYLDPQRDRIQSGFQLFTTLRVGYQLRLGSRWWIEPSVAMTAWPVNTNLPGSFQVEEDKWNKFFVGEPGLHFGFDF